MPSAGEPRALGLRERKKAKTRAAIQEHALRLFKAQGYAATTVEQIAEAAEISPSTFFRYFPSKEEVALYDGLDPLMIEAFEAQPAELGPVAAMRAAMHAVLDTLPAGEWEQQWERSQLALSVPELRMRMLDQVTGTVDMTARMLAKRLGRRADDFAVRALAGAMLGAMLSVVLSAPETPAQDIIALIEKSLAFVEDGLPM